ncbi:HAD family hydrolase [Verrucomicrobiota bacterium]
MRTGLQRTTKGVFFDLYGTLLVYGDMEAAWADWLRAFHESLRIFDAALEETGLRPAEVAYVGDTEEDVAAARAAGIVPVVISRPGSATDPGALDFRSGEAPVGRPPGFGSDTTTVASLRELIPLLL